MRNRIAFLIFSILLSSCGGNGNKSKKNQEITDMDSTESVVIDTMVTSPIESKGKGKEPTRVKTIILLQDHIIAKKVAILMSSMTIIVDYFFLNLEAVALLIGTKQGIQLLLLLLVKWSS